jgi:hypothetical protein
VRVCVLVTVGEADRVPELDAVKLPDAVSEAV